MGLGLAAQQTALLIIAIIVVVAIILLFILQGIGPFRKFAETCDDVRAEYCCRQGDLDAAKNFCSEIFKCEFPATKQC